MKRSRARLVPKVWLLLLGIFLILGGLAVVFAVHRNAITEKSTTITNPVATEAQSDNSVSNQSNQAISTGTVGAKSIPADSTCTTTAKTVSGDGGVTLTLSVDGCYKNGAFVSSKASYSYTKDDVHSYNSLYAQINRVYDSKDKLTLYNSSLNYSYHCPTCDIGPTGSQILILNAAVTETGEISFNQNNGG